MTDDIVQTLQKLFYRVNRDGADVYRIDLQNRLKRLDLEKIAEIDIENDTIVPVDRMALSNEERDDMQNWCLARQDKLELRHQNDINRLIESMNHAANWIEHDASEAQIDQISDTVLMAMHDLRATVVRKMVNNNKSGKNNG